MLIVHTSIPGPSLPASWLNRRVSVSHTGVSSDGTELRRSTLPFASLRRTAWRLVSTAVTSGAGCPGLISGPTRVRGVPLKVTTPLRSSAMEVPSWSLGVRRDCRDSRRVYIVRYTAARERAVMLGYLLIAALVLSLAPPAGAQSSVVILSTTTSTQDSGLLDVLVPIFERRQGRDPHARARALEAGGCRACRALVHRVGPGHGRDARPRRRPPRVHVDRSRDAARLRQARRAQDHGRGRPRAAQHLLGDGGQSRERAPRQRRGRQGVRRLHGLARGPADHQDLRRRPVRPAAVRPDRRQARGGRDVMTLLLDGVRQALGLLVSGDGEIWSILWLSLEVSGSATLISLLIGIPAGTALALTRFSGRGLVVSAVNSGMGLPPVVVGLFVTIVLWRSGPLGSLEILYTPAAIVLAQAVIASPIVTGITLAAVQQVPREFRLQLLALGASRVQMVWTVLREARLPMLAAVMAGRGGGIADIGGPMVEGGDNKRATRTLTTAMVLETSKGDFDVAIALSLLLLALVFLVNWALTSIQQRRAG